MANSSFPLGMHAEPQGLATCLSLPPIAKSTSSVEALFVGSPYYIVSSEARSALITDAAVIKGTVIALRDANGKPVKSLAATAAGTIEGTHGADTIYRIRINSTAFAAGDVQLMYNLTAETGTVQTSTADGSVFSTKMLDGATENATARQLIVIGKTPLYNNDAATAYTELFVKINPVNYQP